MILPNHHDLKYGVIYVYFDPKRHTDSVRGKDIIEKIAHPFTIEWVEDPQRGKDNTELVARRFNVGNVGQCATVTLRMSDSNPFGTQFDALHEFREKLFEVSDTDGGDIVIDEADFAIRPSIRYSAEKHDMSCREAAPPNQSAAPQDHTRVESTARKIGKKASKWLRELQHVYPSVVDRVDEQIMRKPEVDLLKSEQTEVENLERTRKRALERIRQDIVNYIAQYHDDPKDLMQELLRGKVVMGTPGRVLVNGDLKIVLPEYDEMEIEMPAMCRTLYILFMKNRLQGGSGIILKNIDEYRDEIIDIYGLVKPGANEDRVVMTVSNLCDPSNDYLHQTISRINRCIRTVMTDKTLAQDYCITGSRGEPYGIALDPQYLELPHAVTD